MTTTSSIEAHKLLNYIKERRKMLLRRQKELGDSKVIKYLTLGRIRELDHITLRIEQMM